MFPPLNVTPTVGKANPMKYFVSHRPTDPMFWKSKKKRFPDLFPAFFFRVFRSFDSCNYILKSLRHISHPRKTSSNTIVSEKILVQNFRGGEATIQTPAVRIFYHYPIVYCSFSFFCPTDWPTFTGERAMGKETFHGDGLNMVANCWRELELG